MHDSHKAKEPAARTMELCFTQEGAIAGNQILHRLFCEGWETLEPVRYYECGHYVTILYWPQVCSAGNPTEP